MNFNITLSNIKAMQGTLQALTALQLISFWWPPQSSIRDGAEFDYIIVGSGPAGLALANRLTEDTNNTVLVLEAGGEPPLESALAGLLHYLPSSKMDWQFKTENDGYTAQAHRENVVSIISGKMLGGSSSLDTMIFKTGTPHYYDTWATIARDETWNWENLLPYFKKIEKYENPDELNENDKLYHGTDGYVGITKNDKNVAKKYLDALKEVGHDIISDINGDKNIGYCEPMYTIANSLRQSAALTILKPNRDRSNLHVLKEALATKVLFDKDNNARGVEVITRQTLTIKIKAKKEVIVSAGPFNTVKLLMHSGIGPKEHLESFNISVRSDLPVGENLIDYARIPIVHKTEIPYSFPGLPTNDPTKFQIPVVIGNAVLNKTQPYADYYTESYVFPLGQESSSVPYCSLIAGLKDKYCQTIYDTAYSREILFTMFTDLNPLARGKVLLRSIDPKDPPLIFTNRYSNKEELENGVKFIKDFNRIVNSTFYKTFKSQLVDLDLPNCKGLEIGSSDYWRSYLPNVAGSMMQSAGTAALGSVVDSKLRVYGVKKLRVADLSIVPVLTGGESSIIGYVIGEKAADFIAEENN